MKAGAESTLQTNAPKDCGTGGVSLVVVELTQLRRGDRRIFMSRNESDTHNKDAADEHREWLELSKLANVEVSSEQPEHPAASVLMPIT